MTVGVSAALLMNQSSLTLPLAWVDWIALPGDLFIDILKMIIVPLVLSSVILGVTAAGSLNALEKLGVRIIPYFIMTTAIAITIGIGVATFVNPGQYIDQSSLQTTAEAPQTLENLTVPDRIRNILPVNIVEAQLQKNMLQLVVLGLIIGIALLTIQTKASKTIYDICSFTQDTCMMVVGWAMFIAPFAVASLLFTALSTMGSSVLTGLGYYMACVIGGLLLMMIVYGLIVFIFGKRSPFQFFNTIKTAQIVAFSTSSSAATMPISLNVARNRLKTNEDVHDFVIPLGATVNMDGTALYQACAAIFLCQAFGIDLSMGETVLLLLATIGASIGTPAMPGVGLIVLATILSAIGVPPVGVGIILGVDRILDMMRTTVNVTGDLTATVVMQQWLHGPKKNLKNNGDESRKKV